MYINVEGDTQYLNPYVIKGYKKHLIINDLHIGKHNKKAINTTLERLSDFDTLIINGDMMDFEGVSRFKKHPKKKQIEGEIELVKNFLGRIRNKFKGEIYYKYGNHEKRLDDYIWLNAEALFELEAIKLENLLELKSFNIIPIEHSRIIKIGDLNVIHGHEIKASGNLINVARNYLLKTMANLLLGHWHIVQVDSIRALNNEIKTVWVNGCLCDLYPEFNLFNRWEHGFAEVVNDKNGYTVTLRKIINGKVF